MSVKLLAFLVAVLAATTASATSDPVMWLWERAWPKAQVEHKAPPPVSAVVAPAVEVKPVPRPRPKVEARPARPKPEKEPATRRRATAPAKKTLPSCAAVKREYEAMNYSQRMSAYFHATPEEIAHGKRCLGM